MVKRSQSQSSNPRFDDNLSRFVPKPDERDIEYNNMQEAYKARQVNKMKKNEDISMSTPMEKGFADKCSQMGVNPSVLLKIAQANPDIITGSTFRTQGPVNTASPASTAGPSGLDEFILKYLDPAYQAIKHNPAIAGAGAGAVVGAGAGALSKKDRVKRSIIGLLAGAGVGGAAGAGFDPRAQALATGKGWVPDYHRAQFMMNG